MATISKGRFLNACPNSLCFGYDRGTCTVLTETPEDCFTCSFFKTQKQLESDRLKAEERLCTIKGGADLWDKYHGNEAKNARARAYRARLAAEKEEGNNDE